MNPLRLLLDFVVVVPVSGLIAYWFSSWIMRRQVSTLKWALLCFLVYSGCALAAIFIWPGVHGASACVFGCTFGGGLGRTQHFGRDE